MKKRFDVVYQVGSAIVTVSLKVINETEAKTLAYETLTNDLTLHFIEVIDL